MREEGGRCAPGKRDGCAWMFAYRVTTRSTPPRVDSDLRTRGTQRDMTCARRAAGPTHCYLSVYYPPNTLNRSIFHIAFVIVRDRSRIPYFSLPGSRLLSRARLHPLSALLSAYFRVCIKGVIYNTCRDNSGRDNISHRGVCSYVFTLLLTFFVFYVRAFEEDAVSRATKIFLDTNARVYN